MLYILFTSLLSSALAISLCSGDQNSYLKAETIRELHPRDIDLVLALGDSISAGFGMDDNLNEHRGVSFSAGGETQYADQDKSIVFSLPNLFKIYNPNVEGFSIGTHGFEHTGWPHDNDTDRLNGAQSSAHVENLSIQITYVIEQLSSGTYGDPEEALKKKWKYLTLFIGANNLCQACHDAESNTPDFFEKQIQSALETLYEKLPRTFVSLVAIPQFSKLRTLEPNVGWCKFLHAIYSECQCVFAKATDSDRVMVDQYTERYNTKLRGIYSYWQQKLSLDGNFGVAYHPFNEFTTIPDESYLSKVDCFHPSRLAHKNFAMATWNSLFLKFEDKPDAWQFNETLYCPTEFSRMLTI